MENHHFQYVYHLMVRICISCFSAHLSILARKHHFSHVPWTRLSLERPATRKSGTDFDAFSRWNYRNTSGFELWTLMYVCIRMLHMFLGHITVSSWYCGKKIKFLLCQGSIQVERGDDLARYLIRWWMEGAIPWPVGVYSLNFPHSSTQ